MIFFFKNMPCKHLQRGRNTVVAISATTKPHICGYRHALRHNYVTTKINKETLSSQFHALVHSSHLATLFSGKCRGLKLLSATPQSKYAEQARARRVGVADPCDACSDWSTLRLQFCRRQMSPTFFVSATNIDDTCQPV